MATLFASLVSLVSFISRYPEVRGARLGGRRGSPARYSPEVPQGAEEEVEEAGSQGVPEVPQEVPRRGEPWSWLLPRCTRCNTTSTPRSTSRAAVATARNT